MVEPLRQNQPTQNTNRNSVESTWGLGRTRVEAVSKVTPGRSLGSCPQRPSCCVGGREGGPLTSNCCPRQDLEVSGVRLTERPQDAQRELGHSLGGGDFGELGPVLQAWLWSR